MTTPANRAEAAPSARPLPALSWLIQPVDLATFQRDYWERRPLVVHRRDPGYYAELMTLDDIDQIMSLSNVASDNLRVVVSGKETPVSELVSSQVRNGTTNMLEEVYQRYRTGSTLVLNALELRWEPLQRLSRSLGSQMNCRLQMNIYLTPAGAQGFAPHYDTHDVFVAQVYGTKRWRLAMAPYALPLRSQPYDKAQPEPTPEQEFDLRAGDIAYLPRGTLHWATSNEKASAHVTVGVHPVLYSQTLTDCMRTMFTEDVRFRKALPVRFALDKTPRREALEAFAELAAVLRERLTPELMVAESVKRATSISMPALRHHLTDLEGLAELSSGTRLRRRPDLVWTLTVTGDAVRLDFHNKTVQLPAHVAGELRYITESNSEGLTADDIPGDLDQLSRMVLVQTLLREGFLTLA